MPDSRRLHYDIINIRKKERIEEKKSAETYSTLLHCRPTTSESRKTMTHRVSTIRVHITNFSKLKKKATWR